MRHLYTLPLLLTLAACSTVDTSQLQSDQDWYDHGYTLAQQGHPIAELNLTDAQSGQYAKYQQGYEAGQSEYCSQNPVMLGIKGKPYMGICDWTFERDYLRGRQRLSERL